MGVSTHEGGGGLHVSWQLSPSIGVGVPKGVQNVRTLPAGHVPLSGSAMHARKPPQHGCWQYCVALHVSDPHANGPLAGGSAASLWPESSRMPESSPWVAPSRRPASAGAWQAMALYATDHWEAAHVAVDGPPESQP
jgi:hypothetical protein